MNTRFAELSELEPPITALAAMINEAGDFRLGEKPELERELNNFVKKWGGRKKTIQILLEITVEAWMDVKLMHNAPDFVMSSLDESLKEFTWEELEGVLMCYINDCLDVLSRLVMG